ncbi:peptidyl-tRNA hydrolase [Ectothiorhodospira mobilis]|uniref:Peptidyl-tRNA hydrolase n=1 Tax=Ectothiorhodospira mobilis TaxID=195064 RepID=A0A1I4SUS9_ECTMO|nr:aminoacyl-tRNA hydrolase [Ectothiorhodospira mobilis]SFM68090.1 peptidyl-tRNA hydrolase [Ectothiorhodospira mobilis]
MSETPSIRLIAGLGNPGPRYDRTRHNAGFWFVEALARRHGGHFKSERRFAGDVARVQLEGQEVWLLKPMSFMNHSGQPIRLLADFYKIPPEAILVVHDEIDLPPGAARLKRGGGHGGHNGLRHIMGHMGQDFLRLRLGVGHPGHRDEVVPFVLSRPPKAEEEAVTQAIERALDVVPEVVTGALQQAMNRLHS